MKPIIELLAKPVWSYKDIMAYASVSKATAIKIKNRAINENGGCVKFGSHLATTDSVLALYGTDRKTELLLLTGEENEK